MSLVGNTKSSLPYLMGPSSTQLPAPVATVEDLQKMSQADQVDYLEAHGSGSPPALLLPAASGAGESLASLAPSGSAVTVTAAPAAFLSFLAQVPTGSSANTPSATVYGTWRSDLETFYFDQKASGSPPALILPNGTGQALVTMSEAGALQIAAAPDQFWANLFGTTYNGMKPQDPASPRFFTDLSGQPGLQAYYFAQKATGSPPTLLLSDQQGPALALMASDGTIRVATATAQALADLTGEPFDGTAPEATPAAKDFAGWDPALRAYYFAQNAAGSPPALVLPDGPGQALALLEGSKVTVERLPDAFWADLTGRTFVSRMPQAVPTLTDFNSWSPAVQAYFLAQKGQGADKTVALQDDRSPQADSYLFASLGSTNEVQVTSEVAVPGFAAGLSMPTSGSTYDPATLEQFQSWPPAYQTYYLTAKGGGALLQSSATPTPDGVRQASLSASGGIAYSKVQSLTDLWNTTTSAPSAAAILGQTRTLTADTLALWPLASQVNYLQRNGSGSPPALLMPTAAGSQALVSLAPGSNVVQIAPPPDGFLSDLDAQPSATALTPVQFDALASADQAAYLASRVDAVTAKKFQTWSASNQAAYLATQADQATLAQFQSWPAQFQIYYLANKGAGSPPSLILAGGADGSVVATVSGDGAGVQLTATSTKRADDAAVIALTTPILPRIFFALTPDEQLQYANNRLAAKQQAYYLSNINSGYTLAAPTGAGDINVLDLDGSSGGYTTTTLTIAGKTFKVALPTSTPGALSGEADYGGFGSGSVMGATFATWPPEVRSAFVEQKASGPYPKTVVLGDGGTVAIIASSGAPVDTVVGSSSAGVAFKDAYAGKGMPDATDFLLWPYACQLAWLRKQSASPVTVGTNPNDIQVALNADGSGFQVAMATDLATYVNQTKATDPLTDAQRTVAVQGIDFALFGKVASPQLQAQLLATLEDPGSSPPIITVQRSLTPLKTPAVISGGTATTGQGFTIEPLPSNYATAPGALTPAAFMAWSPAVRESYALAQQKAPLYIGSGTDVLAITFSATDGTLRISLPQTLSNLVTSGTGASAVTTALAGTLLPYDYLPGSAVGTASAVNDAVSAALYPILDGSGGAHDIAMSAQQKIDFAKQPTALAGSTFAGWPTPLQLQYLRAYQAPGTPLTIGSGSDTLDALMQTTALAGAVPKVYIVQNLQKADIGMMSYADQATLAKSKAFTAIANGLGLIPDDGTTAALTGNDVPDPNAGLTSAAKSTATAPALSAFGFVQTMFVRALNTIDNPTLVAPTALPDGNMPAADRKVFEDEVNLLRRQTFGSPLPTSQQNQSGGQAVFSPKDIQDKLTAIIQRFTRANAFSSIANSKTATAGYFQIQNMTGSDPAEGRLKYVYNPDGKTENAVEGDLGYYLLGDDRYRVPDRTAQYPDPQDYFQSRLASAFSSYSSQLPTGFGVPFTLSGMGLTLSTTNHDNGVDSNGNYPAGDSMTIDTMTIQRIDGGVKDNWIQEHETDGSKDDGLKNVYNTFSVNGVTYEIMSMSGSKLNASNNVPSTFSSLASSTYESNYHPYTQNLSDFENARKQSDDGKAVLDYINGLMNDPTVNYKDGNTHTITIQSSAGLPSSNLNLGGFNVYNVTVRYVPAAASVDNNATIDSGYQTFMAQEKSVLDLANRADQLATSGRIGGTQQNLDVPNLVYLFMMYANLTGEAVLRADTEEVNQTNAVLNEYAIMQKIINQTVAAIKPGSNGAAGSGSLKGSNPDGSFTAQDMGALAMFTHGNSTAGTGNAVGQNPPLSPIELLQSGFTRPYLSHGIDYDQSSTQWSSDGTSLSDAVTQLNQASQLKMNDINSETKQKDREFDLANTALQKMSDIVNKIAASI